MNFLLQVFKGITIIPWAALINLFKGIPNMSRFIIALLAALGAAGAAYIHFQGVRITQLESQLHEAVVASQACSARLSQVQGYNTFLSKQISGYQDKLVALEATRKAKEASDSQKELKAGLQKVQSEFFLGDYL